MKKSILSFLLGVNIILFINGCASSGYKDFYTRYYNDSDEEFRKKYPELEFLKEGEEPLVYRTNDFKKDMILLNSRRYFPIGKSSFNGEFEGEKAIIEQAKSIGAKIALYEWKYTDTQTNSGVIMLPKNNYSTSTFNGNAGGTMYSGTLNTQSTGTQMIPYTNTQRRYDQTAVFFVKSNGIYNFGTAKSYEISRDERINIGSNGVKIRVIIENTPAYKSDLMVGDIVTEINSHKINNIDDYNKLTEKCVSSKNNCTLKVYRKGKEKNIIIKFK